MDLWCEETKEYLQQGVKSLREWAIAQESVEKKAEGVFDETPEKVQEIFYNIMFGYGSLSHLYWGNSKGIWEFFKKIWGPVRTKSTPDFCSSYRMKRFLEWCLENPPQDSL